METDKNSIDELIASIEDYSKTSIDLLSLKFVDKTSQIFSKLIFYSILIFVFSFFLILVSIGGASKIGQLLGAEYYGFLIVAGLYALVGIILLSFFSKTVVRIKNSIISSLLN